VATASGSGVGCRLSTAQIQRAIEKAGVATLPTGAAERFEAYLGLLLKWNARLNLTADCDPERIVSRHFAECIQCAQKLPALPEGAALLDFGSGAGLPGVPIAVCRPEIRVTLAESQRKKAAFLQEVVRSLGLAVEVFDGRVEQMPTERRFSVVTLRAVDRMTEACRTSWERVAPGGWVVLFATRATMGQIKAALPEAEWQAEVALAGSEQALLLFGKRT